VLRGEGLELCRACSQEESASVCVVCGVVCEVCVVCGVVCVVCVVCGVVCVVCGVNDFV
jgi:hypothetical protein